MEPFTINHDVRVGPRSQKPRYKSINVRLSSAEHNRTTAIAYQQGKSVSDMMRHYLNICLDLYEKEFGPVSYKGSPEVKPKVETLADVLTLTIEADETRTKDGWSEAQRIAALKKQSESSDKVVAQAALDVYAMRKAEKATGLQT